MKKNTKSGKTQLSNTQTLVKPTRKQRRFAKEYLINNKSMYRASQDAGYSENTAVNATVDILDKPGTQQALAELAQQYQGDFTIEELQKRLRKRMKDPSINEHVKLQMDMKLYEICKKTSNETQANTILDSEHEELQALITDDSTSL